MIELIIRHVTEDRTINLRAEAMKELVDDKLQLFLPMLADDLPLLKQGALSFTEIW